MAKMRSYYQVDAISNSALRAFKQSPRTYAAYMAAGTKPTDAMRLGSAAHALILEGRQVALLQRAVEGSWNRKENQAAKKAMQTGWLDDGICYITEDEMEAIAGMHAAVKSDKLASDLIAGCQHFEHEMYWQDKDGTGYKALADGVSTVDGYLLDLKTSKDANPKKYQFEILRDGWIQAGHYSVGYHETTGEMPKRFFWIVVEQKPPHNVSILEFGPESLREAMRGVRELHGQLLQAIMQDTLQHTYTDKHGIFTLDFYHDGTTY